MTKPEKTDKSKPNWGTLAGWGALLSGVAAIAALFINNDPSNSSGNTATPQPTPTPIVTTPAEPSSPPDTDTKQAPDDDDDFDLPKIEDSIQLIDPAEITTDYHQEPQAIKTKYLGKTLAVENTFNAADVEPCRPALTTDQENRNSVPTWGDSNSSDSGEFWCISKEYSHQGSGSYFNSGVFRCHFSEDDAQRINDLNTRLYDRGKNNEEGLRLTLVGRMIGIQILGGQTGLIQSTTDDYQTYFTTRSPVYNGKYVATVVFADCQLSQ